jgi:hypothetical protein
MFILTTQNCISVLEQVSCIQAFPIDLYFLAKMRPVIIRADVNCDEGKNRLCQEKVDDAIFLVGYPGCRIIPIYETFLISGAVRTGPGRPSLSDPALSPPRPGQRKANHHDAHRP